MNIHTNQHYYILTGAMGAGKSTILNELRNKGLMAINEPAREVIAQQREIEGEGIYDSDPKLFYNLMLSRALFQYQQYESITHPIIWDRGIADNIGYAELFKLNTHAAINASKCYRYNYKVFFLPAVESIYVNDEERKMSFLQAQAFGERIRRIYIELGYTLVEIPFDTPQARAKFIINNI